MKKNNQLNQNILFNNKLYKNTRLQKNNFRLNYFS